MCLDNEHSYYRSTPVNESVLSRFWSFWLALIWKKYSTPNHKKPSQGLISFDGISLGQNWQILGFKQYRQLFEHRSKLRVRRANINPKIEEMDNEPKKLMRTTRPLNLGRLLTKVKAKKGTSSLYV